MRHYLEIQEYAMEQIRLVFMLELQPIQLKQVIVCENPSFSYTQQRQSGSKGIVIRQKCGVPLGKLVVFRST